MPVLPLWFGLGFELFCSNTLGLQHSKSMIMFLCPTIAVIAAWWFMLVICNVNPVNTSQKACFYSWLWLCHPQTIQLVITMKKTSGFALFTIVMVLYQPNPQIKTTILLYAIKWVQQSLYILFKSHQIHLPNLSVKQTSVNFSSSSATTFRP